MIQRCFNPNNPAFKHYGRRGITVCDSWRNFENFFSDVGEGKIGWELERVNNDGNYELNNIVWATRVRQMRNTRRTPFYTVAGVTGCVIELAEHFGINPRTLHERLYKGWDVERACLHPVRTQNRSSP